MQRSLLHQITFTIPFGGTANDINNVVADIVGYRYDYIGNKEFVSRYNYNDRYTLKSSENDTLITVYANGFSSNQYTLCVEINGIAFEESACNPLILDVPRLAQKIIEHKGSCSNLHLALDDLDNVLPYDDILIMCNEENYQDRLRTPLCRKYGPRWGGGIGPTQSIYIGSRKSNHICIYRKHKQMGTKFPWVRVEVRLRKRQDTAKVLDRIAAGEYVGKIAADYVKTYLSFVAPGVRSVRYRRVMPWWDCFLAEGEKLKLSAYRQQPKPKQPAPINKQKLQRELDRFKQRFPDDYSAFIKEIAENDSISF